MQSPYSLKERLHQWWLRVRCPSDFLCDFCQLDSDSTCNRHERPNAKRCPDYTPKR